MRMLNWRALASPRNLMIMAVSLPLLGLGVQAIARRPSLTPTVRGERRGFDVPNA